eukprot:g12344.t1
MTHENRGVTLSAGSHGVGDRASVDSTFFSLASDAVDGRSSTGEYNDFDVNSFYDPFQWQGARVRTASTSSELPSDKNNSVAALLRSDSDAETTATPSGRAHVTKTILERDWLRRRDANAENLSGEPNRVALVVFVCGFLAARQAGVQSNVHEVKLGVLLEAAAEELPAARSWKLPARQSELYLSPVTHLYTSLLPFFVVIPCCLLWAPARSSTRAVLFSIAFLGFLLNAVFSVPWFLLSAEAEQTKLTSALLRRVDPGSVYRLQERLRAEDTLFEDGPPEAWDRKSLLQFLDAVGTYTAAERRHDGYLDLERWQWWQFVIRPESRQLGHVEVEVELAASDVEHVESTSAPKIARRQQQRNNEKSGQDQIVPCLRVPCLSGEVSNSGSYGPDAEVERRLRAAVFLEKHHRDMLLLKRADVMRIAGALQLVAEEVDHVEPSDHLVTIGSHFRPPAVREDATEVICDALPVVPGTFRLTAADLQTHILDVYGSLELCLLRYCYQCPDPDVTSDPSRVLFQLLKQQVFWRKHFLHPFLVGSTSCKNADKNEENPVSKRGLETLKHLLVEKWTPTIGMQPLLVDTGPWVADDGFAIEAWDCRYIQSRACLNKYSRKEIKN